MGSFSQRLGKKVKSVGRTLGKVALGGLALGGAVLGAKKLYDSGKETAETISNVVDTGQNVVANAQVLGQQAIQGGQAVVGAGVIGAQAEAQQQANKIAVMGNLGLDGANLGEIVKAQKKQKEKLKEVKPAVKPNLGSNVVGFGGGGGGDAEVERAVKMARCSQKFGKGLRYKACMKKG
tara:strand:- start:714 stop:1250 length:537 start_codon:yes stop_codon:yes gene_type:complete